MQLVIAPDGQMRCVYDETLDLHKLGRITIARGSHVEPDVNGEWIADLSPLKGPLLGPFRLRSEALDAERRWIESNWLIDPPRPD